MPEPSTSSEAKPERKKTPLARMVERLDAKLRALGHTVVREDPLAADELEAFFIPTVARERKQPESEPSES